MCDLSKELGEIKDQLKRIADALEDKKPQVPQKESSQSQSATVSVKWVRGLFKEEQQAILAITDEGDYVKAKAGYLKSEKFAELARIVQDNGGEYISAGKDSHFRFHKGA